MSEYLVGIDVGTTGSKAMVVDLSGNILGSGYREYQCIYPRQNWVEQDAELIIQKTFEACKEAIKNSKVEPKDIGAAGFSSQRATFALVDESNEVIDGKFYSWQDNRAITELEYITGRISADELHTISGIPITPTFSFEKIVWIMRNELEKYDRAKYIVLMPDYVIYRFGADKFYCEVTNACTSGMIDIQKLKWSDKILDTYAIDINKLPGLVNPGTIVGKVSREVSEKTSLPEGTLLCTGTGDQQCASLGAGVIKDGYASMTLGTSGLLVVGINKPSIEECSGLMVTSSANLGLYQVEGIQLGAASSYRWIRDVAAGAEKSFGEDINVDAYILMDYHLQKSPVGANGVIFMPYLMGSGYPYWNPEAKGLFAGLKFSNSKSDIIRAVMEGITLESKDMYETMKTSGVCIQSLAITGGATKSAAWRQIIADMFNIEIKILKVPDATIMGAVILAGVGIGLYRDVEEGVSILVSFTDIVKPIPENVNKYNRIYSVYKSIYETMNKNGIYKKLSELSE